MNKHSLLIGFVLLLGMLSGCAERQNANTPYGPGGNVLAYLGRVPVRGAAMDVATIGNLAYVADEPYGISIYDLTDPANPVYVDSLRLVDSVKVRLISIDPTGRIAAIQQTNNVGVYDLKYKKFLFPVGSSNHIKIELHFANDTLIIYRSDKDVIDGFNRETFALTQVNDTLSFGSLVDAANYTYNQSVYGFALSPTQQAFITRDLEGFVVADPSVIGTITPYTLMNVPGAVLDAALSGGTLCLASGYEGLQTVDVTDPRQPIFRGSLSIHNSPDIEWVEAVGNRAYLLDNFDGAYAADVSDPAHPKLIGDLPTSDPNNFCLSGDLILIADMDMGLVVGQILY
ncbi:MAG: hypothetical protein NTW14_10650 [bacterium]|nr:hypothetical protein [bacterium]